MCQIETAVNHEVRTALNAIMGFAQILNSRENTKEEVHSYAGIICQQSENLLEIFNDMLSRINPNEVNPGFSVLKSETSR
jgi:signal transduction histidine kinase